MSIETRLSELGEAIAREQDALLERHNVHSEVRERLALLDLPLQSSGFRTRVLFATGAALSMAVALVAWVGLRTPHPATLPLTAHLGASEEPLALGHFVEAPAIGPLAMNFSDGSKIQIAEHGRARLVGLKPNGADVSLESGLLHVKVQHHEGSSWHISAGPFGVHVTGTRFDVRWSPEDDAFELSLIEGQVEVSGCEVGAGFRVQAGQTVRASCRTKRFFDVSTASTALGNASAATSTPSPAASVVAPPVEVVQPPVHTPATPASASKPSAEAPPAAPKPLSWQALARTGRYAQAMQAVRGLGFEREVQRANAEELTLLANLARYGQDGDGEATALQTLRERFRGTKRAALAAFALGRLEFDNHGAYAEAAEWFRIYLREEPRGDLSREATGRLLEATQRSGNAAMARELAQRYLAEYPDGPHAELAQRLASGK